MDFSTLKLNSKLQNSLNNLQSGGRMPHAVILSGGNERFRSAVADRLAQWAVCGSDGERPCGACKNCLNAAARSHSDIYYAKGSGKTDIYSIREIQYVIRDASIKPNQADRKVYVFENCDKKLADISQNALLKTLEEPVQSALFILTCDNSKSLLETIRSRCAVIELGEDSSADSDCVQTAEDIAAGILSSSEMDLLKNTYRLQNRFSAVSTLDVVVGMLGSGLVMKAGGEPEEYIDIAEKLCRKLTQSQFLKLIEITRSAQKKINQNVSSELVSVWLCSQYRKTVW